MSPRFKLRGKGAARAEERLQLDLPRVMMELESEDDRDLLYHQRGISVERAEVALYMDRLRRHWSSVGERTAGREKTRDWNKSE